MPAGCRQCPVQRSSGAMLSAATFRGLSARMRSRRSRRRWARRADKGVSSEGRHSAFPGADRRLSYRARTLTRAREGILPSLRRPAHAETGCYPIRIVKLSISLPDQQVGFLDAYARSHGIKSRSGAIQAAVRLLRTSQLADGYASPRASCACAPVGASEGKMALPSRPVSRGKGWLHLPGPLGCFA